MSDAVFANTLNTVLYALSTIAQTCAALAALVGALGLFKMTTMREAHVERERGMRATLGQIGRDPQGGQFDDAIRVARETVIATETDPRIVKKLRHDLDEYDILRVRYARVGKRLVIFVTWNLFAILAALVGFAFASWLALHWCVFVTALIVLSVGTAGVTGGALWLMARRD